MDELSDLPAVTGEVGLETRSLKVPLLNSPTLYV